MTVKGKEIAAGQSVARPRARRAHVGAVRHGRPRTPDNRATVRPIAKPLSRPEDVDTAKALQLQPEAAASNQEFTCFTMPSYFS